MPCNAHICGLYSGSVYALVRNPENPNLCKQGVTVEQKRALESAGEVVLRQMKDSTRKAQK